MSMGTNFLLPLNKFNKFNIHKITAWLIHPTTRTRNNNNNNNRNN